VFDIDRFYTPKSIVHKTINGKNNPIGALGLQQVSSSLPAKMYAEEIMNNPDKEIPVSAASCFNTYQDMLKVQEYYNIEETNDMKVLKEYLTKRGIKL
jgi:organic hydroperoxide reductase OsmC/OhrA